MRIFCIKFEARWSPLNSRFRYFCCPVVFWETSPRGAWSLLKLCTPPLKTIFLSSKQVSSLHLVIIESKTTQPIFWVMHESPLFSPTKPVSLLSLGSNLTFSQQTTPDPGHSDSSLMWWIWGAFSIQISDPPLCICLTASIHASAVCSLLVG